MQVEHRCQLPDWLVPYGFTEYLGQLAVLHRVHLDIIQVLVEPRARVILSAPRRGGFRQS